MEKEGVFDRRFEKEIWREELFMVREERLVFVERVGKEVFLLLENDSFCLLELIVKFFKMD